MLPATVKSSELKLKVFDHGNMYGLVEEIKGWLKKENVDVLDISYVVQEEAGSIYAAVTYKG
jgi:hypothetical protein